MLQLLLQICERKRRTCSEGFESTETVFKHLLLLGIIRLRLKFLSDCCEELGETLDALVVKVVVVLPLIQDVSDTLKHVTSEGVV